jgi:hypothetical protein
MVVLLTGLLFGAVAWAQDLRVRDAWIREAPPGVRTHAGYATLEAGGAAVRVVGVRGPDFSSAEIHEMTTQDGVMRMRALPRIEIAAGARHNLAPGGEHLMLFNARRRLREGDQCGIEFVLDDGSTVSAVFVVRRAAP